MGVFIGQISGFADQPDVRAIDPGLADPGVQHRGLDRRVGADQLDELGAVQILDRGGADIGPPVAGGQFRAIGAAFDSAAQTFDQLFQGKCGLDRNQITDQAGNLLALHRLGRLGQRLGPGGRAQLAVFADVRTVQTLAAQAIPDKAGLVGNPFLVHAVMVARQDAHDFAALGIDADVRPKRIHHVDGFSLGQFPRAGGKGVGFGHQRTNRAEVDDIALQVRIQRLVQVAGDLRILTASGLAHLHDTRDLGGEADTARAGNAARHVGFDQRAQIQIVAGAFGFAVAREIDAIGHRLILQVAFAALVADRAIQRMVDQQEFHDPFAGLLDHGAVGLDHRRRAFRPGAQILDLHRAGGGGLRRAADDLDQAHAAVARDGQTFVIAKARHLDPGLFTGLDQGQGGIDLDLLIVDDDLAQVRHGLSLCCLCAGVRRCLFPGASAGVIVSGRAVRAAGGHLRKAPIWLLAAISIWPSLHRSSLVSGSSPLDRMYSAPMARMRDFSSSLLT